MGYLNINSLRHKVIHVKEALKRSLVKGFGIAETKIDDSFPEAQFLIDGYRIFRHDRTQHGGGLVAYVQLDLPCRCNKSLETIEMLSIEIITC
jgi:exonuclease III